MRIFRRISFDPDKLLRQTRICRFTAALLLILTFAALSPAPLSGVFLAAGIVVVQFIVDDRIHSEEDITKYLDLPVLGMMPSQRQEVKENKKKQPHKKDSNTKREETEK